MKLLLEFGNIFLENLGICFSGFYRHTYNPGKECELTANTLSAHMKTHSKLILKPLIYLIANSQDELTL